jgi:Porin subfamily
MGAIHSVNASYYSADDNVPGYDPFDIGTCTSAACLPNVFAGHPDDKVGFAIGAGLKVNFPSIAPGDWFQAQFNYTEGALRYIFFTPSTDWGKIDGDSEAFGVLSDCVYGGLVDEGTTTSCHLTTAWGFNASYEHYWTPAFHTSVYGGYDQVTYDKGIGSANAMLCAAAGDGIGSGTEAVAALGCDNDWSLWFIGSRTQWNVTSSFYMGVDVMYENLHSATTTGNLLTGGVAPGGTGYLPIFGYAYGSLGGPPVFQEANSDNWIVRVRMHKNFLP